MTHRHITGRCHCGNLSFDFELPDPGPTIAVRACGCSFCLAHGGVYTSHPEGQLTGHVADANELNLYRFGHETADFYICRRCGVVPFVTSAVDGTLRAVVNVNTFTNVAADEMQASRSDFEAESSKSRMSRRGGNWIGSVTIVGPQ